MYMNLNGVRIDFKGNMSVTNIHKRGGEEWKNLANKSDELNTGKLSCLHPPFVCTIYMITTLLILNASCKYDCRTLYAAFVLYCAQTLYLSPFMTARDGRGFRAVDEVFDRPEFLEVVGRVWTKHTDKQVLRAGKFPVTFGQLAFTAFKVSGKRHNYLLYTELTSVLTHYTYTSTAYLHLLVHSTASRC